MEAGTLNCPQCGAAVASDSTQCAYCHALLQTVACPHCMGMMFAGTRFCPHCGALTDAVAKGGKSSFTCPRCELPLQDVSVARTPLEECLRCGGLWVDITNFERICSDAESQQAATGLAVPREVAIDNKVRYLKCPQCAKLMSRLNYADRSGIIINVCRAHGIWLDRDEMRKIITFIRAGGLDRSRKIEAEELQDAQEAAAIDGVEPRVSVYNPTFSESIDADDRVHLLRGIASLRNHFLGASDFKSQA